MEASAEVAALRVGAAVHHVTNAIPEWCGALQTGPHSEYMDQLGNLLSRCAHLLRLDRGPRHAAVGLAAVAVFWVVGLLGGLHVLNGTTNMMLILVALYVMLALVILSLVVGAAATAELSRRATVRWRR
jgi:hypothetical protein